MHLSTSVLQRIERALVQLFHEFSIVRDREKIRGVEIVVSPKLHDTPWNLQVCRQSGVDQRSAIPSSLCVKDGTGSKLEWTQASHTIGESRNALHEAPSAVSQQEVQIVSVELAFVSSRQEFGHRVGNERT